MGCLKCKNMYFTIPQNCVVFHCWGAVPCSVKLFWVMVVPCWIHLAVGR